VTSYAPMVVRGCLRRKGASTPSEWGVAARNWRVSVSEGDSRQLAALVATVVLTVVLGLILRSKLSRCYRRQLDDAERHAF